MVKIERRLKTVALLSKRKDKMLETSPSLNALDRMRIAYSLSDSIALLDEFLRYPYMKGRGPNAAARRLAKIETAALKELAERICPAEFTECRREEI